MRVPGTAMTSYSVLSTYKTILSRCIEREKVNSLARVESTLNFRTGSTSKDSLLCTRCEEKKGGRTAFRSLLAVVPELYPALHVWQCKLRYFLSEAEIYDPLPLFFPMLFRVWIRKAGLAQLSPSGE
jgi:hypothetical protein